MRFRLGLVIGFGAGYVLGSKAGREQYDRIMAATKNVMETDIAARARDLAGKATGGDEESISVNLDDIPEPAPDAPSSLGDSNPSNGKI